ncbi:MAG: substrate-binding domain-containing protein [Candidatus Bathyarchaeia archaeon]
MKLNIWGIVIIVAALTSLASVGGTFLYLSMNERQSLVIATTTSLFDTGVLDELETHFEAKYNIDLYFVSVGSGIAIQFAQRGDADMLLVHAPLDEFAFLEGGYGVNRKIFAYNFFEIVGPKEDPAKISDLSPTEALSKIIDAGRGSKALWVSRGDNSGTHSKEKQLWEAAGFNWTQIKDESHWFIETGSGMGNTLKTANQLHAYTLTDIGTYLSYSLSTSNLIPNLVELVTEGQDLLNVYSAIVVNPTHNLKVKFENAMTFIKYVMSEEGQQIIEEHGLSTYGQPLFRPAVNLLKQDTSNTIAQMIREYAFFQGTECPPQYRYEYSDLYG